MNFLLRNIFFLFVLIFLIINGLLIGGDILLPPEWNSLVAPFVSHAAIIAIFQICILSALAYMTSIQPIRSLKKEIALFLT